MRDLLDRGALTTGLSALPVDAQEVLAAGWVLGPGGSLLLRALWAGGGRSGVPSDIGLFEYHANDVYISLSDLTDDMDHYLVRAASRGVFFAMEMLRNASRFPSLDALVAIVGVFVDTDDEDFLLQGARVRLFTLRGNYPDWFEDLERFESQAVAMIDLSDVAAR
jgi:hypothetical protein